MKIWLGNWESGIHSLIYIIFNLPLDTNSLVIDRPFGIYYIFRVRSGSNGCFVDLCSTQRIQRCQSTRWLQSKRGTWSVPTPLRWVCKRWHDLRPHSRSRWCWSPWVPPTPIVARTWIIVIVECMLTSTLMLPRPRENKKYFFIKKTKHLGYAYTDNSFFKVKQCCVYLAALCRRTPIIKYICGY